MAIAIAVILAVPMTTTAQSVTLIGNMFTDKDPGVYTFKSTNAAKLSGVTGLKALGTDANMRANYGGATIGGQMHCIYMDEANSVKGVFLATTDYIYDINTWQLVGSVSFQNEYVVATCTTVDPLTQQVYGQFLDNQLQNAVIGIVDYDTYQTRQLGPATRRYVAMGMTKTQQLYAIGVDGVLYELSTTDGSELRRIGSTGISLGGTPSVQSAAVDSRTGVFYWAATDSNGQSSVYTVDLSTAKVTLQTRMQSRACMTLLRVEEVNDDAPAVVTNLTVTPIDATRQANVSFTLPTLTFGGTALSGAVSYAIVSGGNTLFSGTGTTGASISQTVTLDEGMQTVAVIASNAQGAGKSVAQSVFIGLDTPAAVTDIEVNVVGNSATVSWTPAQGTNGGNLGDVVYDVFRMPDNVPIAEGISQTTVTDVVAELRSYTYQVVVRTPTAQNSSESYEVVVGPAKNVPYYTNFSDNREYELFTVLNPDEDFFFWGYNSDLRGFSFNNEVNLDNTTPDDWAFTPPLSLKAGEQYVLRFTAHVSGDYAGRGVDRTVITIGPSPLPAMQTTEIVPLQESNNRQPQQFSYDFSVPADGVYYIGFHNISAPLQAAICLTSLEVAHSGGESGVAVVAAGDAVRSGAYNLSGVAVHPSAKGVVIIGARKVVNRNFRRHQLRLLAR